MVELPVLAADAGVRGDLINLPGLVLGVGGIVLAALWLRFLYR